MERKNLRWDSMSFERDRITCGGYVWPQRNYPCSFCKKQFKSAQALGGHMNVHRRERAQLRLQSPPPPSSWDSHSPQLTLNPNPNPNPNFSSLSSSTTFHSSLTTSAAFIDEEKSLVLPKPQFHHDVDLRKKKKKSNGCFLQLRSFREEEESRVLKKKVNVERLDFGMGLVREGKEALDLELRLGFS